MKATHAPHLPYPCHPWPNNCSGHIDASQCVLREPSIITEEDINIARDYLRKHLAGDNGTQALNTSNELPKATTPEHTHKYHIHPDEQRTNPSTILMHSAKSTPSSQLNDYGPSGNTITSTLEKAYHAYLAQTEDSSPSKKEKALNTYVHT